MRLRLGPVVPPAWAWGVAFIPYAFLESVGEFSRRYNVDVGDIQYLDSSILLLAASVAYALFRMLVFHPGIQTNYGNWLKTTPWNHPQPLPLGPVHFVWQDALVLAVPTLLTLRHHNMELPTPVLTFLATYLIALIVGVLLEAKRGVAYLLLFGFGLLVLCRDQYELVAAIVVAMSVIGQVSVRSSLKRFGQSQLLTSSSAVPQVSQQPKLFRFLRDTEKQKPLGFPFDSLSPMPSRAGCSDFDGWSLSALAGWWMYVVSLTHVEAFVPTYVFALALVLLRIEAYCNGAAPPINIVGRILTGRWIIPGYDVVFLAPLGIILVQLFLPSGLVAWGVSQQVAQSFTTANVLAIALNAGPNRLAWRLTGRCRMSVVRRQPSRQAD